METILVSAIIASLISRIRCPFHARGNSGCIAGNRDPTRVFIERACARVFEAYLGTLETRACSNTRKINLNADYQRRKIIDMAEESIVVSIREIMNRNSKIEESSVGNGIVIYGVIKI